MVSASEVHNEGGPLSLSLSLSLRCNRLPEWHLKRLKTAPFMTFNMFKQVNNLHD
jgi:hypothetical protein